MISPALCTSYKAEILRGIHQPGDDYRLALYRASADLSATTTRYTPEGEAAGQGYAAGGQSVGAPSVSVHRTVAVLDFPIDPSWPDSSITARGALLYNATRGGCAVAVLSFDSDRSSSNGLFKVTFPRADASKASVRLE